jgi:hypothetical protein
MIRTREQLIHLLTEAAQIEHNLLCSYLYAVFSLKRSGEDGVSDEQGETLERWRKAILSIALEEMAHLASVNNLLIAVGGAPHFDRANFPLAPGYHPSDVVVRLTPFDEATLDHFIFLERPEGMEMEDGAGFDPCGGERKAAVPGLTPSAEDYTTVGALYDSISEGLRHLGEALGEAMLIDPAGRGQLDSDQVKLPNIARITDLASALATIEQIKEEGEGSTSGRSGSHFDRFLEIKREWAELDASGPGFQPAWPAAHDPVMRKPHEQGARVWITDPDSARYLDLANALYGTMLGALAQAFGGSDPDEQLMMMRLSVELMEASASVSVALARMPAGPEHPGVNAGMTFAVPRNIAYRPLSARSRLIFLERVSQLRDGAERVLSGVAAEKCLRRLGNAAELLQPSAVASSFEGDIANGGR